MPVVMENDYNFEWNGSAASSWHNFSPFCRLLQQLVETVIPLHSFSPRLPTLSLTLLHNAFHSTQETDISFYLNEAEI